MKLKQFSILLCTFLLVSLIVSSATGFDSFGFSGLDDTNLTTNALCRDEFDKLDFASQKDTGSSAIQKAWDRPAGDFNPDLSADESTGFSAEQTITATPTSDSATGLGRTGQHTGINSWRQEESATKSFISKIDRSSFPSLSLTGTQGAVAEGNASSRNTTTLSAPLSECVNDMVEANNRFALDMYKQITANPQYSNSNIFFSPWSIMSAFAISCEGARGTTADEIRSVFHLPDDANVMRTGFSDIDSRLNSRRADYTLHTANALWAEETYPFLFEYISTAGRYYSAEVTNLDFINSPEDSRRIINSWVEDETAGKIEELLPPDSISYLTRLVITNAIYFKGTWDTKFDSGDTHDDDFRVGPGKTVLVRMMQNTDAESRYWYTETDTLQVLGMPYEHDSGSELSMLVILPKDDDLEAAEMALDEQTLSEIRQSLKYERVKVYFPKFTMESAYSMRDMLYDMGMPTAFIDGAADFSGMDGKGGLYISDVYHKAYVDVNEEGTEAAAATAVNYCYASVVAYEPDPVFKADHPFIILIQDDETGNILFMGRVVNPAAL